jgi:Uma2 family endonuclease
MTIMPTMAPTTHLDVLDATEHMPLGSILVVNDFAWDDYELLIQDLDGRRSPRLSYDGGRLEVVSISPRHDAYDRMIDAFVLAFCEAHELALQTYGQATWKLKSVGKGAEGDCCYYVQNARKVVGKDEIPLESNPPPDIVVEIDLTTDSTRKLRIYAGLGVPEVWIVDSKSFHFYELVDGRYVEIPGSKCLPGLTAAPMLDAFEIAKTHFHTEALKAFRRSIRKRKK